MDTHKVLFIGNSYTHCNNLPLIVKEFAASTGQPMETDLLADGGWTLEMHLYNGRTRPAIERGWDTVVLQEMSTRPIEDPQKMLSAGERIGGWIRGAGATPVLYLTWSRQHLPESQEALNRAYRQLGEALDAKVAPAGVAWHKALEADPGLSLYVEDASHPSFLGSYLSACALFSTILGQSPIGLPSAIPQGNGVTFSIDEPIASLLQEAAWATVQEEADRTATT